MIIDTSAAVAMMRGEPEVDVFVGAMDAAPIVRMSTASVLELAIVTAGSGPEIVDAFIDGMGIQLLAVDAEQLRWARHAYQHYGPNSGSSARLNFGDCFAYAAAKATGEPLLFKGNDFIHTDVLHALGQ